MRRRKNTAFSVVAKISLNKACELAVIQHDHHMFTFCIIYCFDDFCAYIIYRTDRYGTLTEYL